MIHCLAIDDEPLALRQLTTYIGKIPYFHLAGACGSAAEARQLMETTPVDVLFIDINMPDVSGIDFVRSLSSRPIVVFTTAYSEYAIEGYKVDAVGYLLKPFSQSDFNQTAEKVRVQYNLLHPGIQNTAPVQEEEDDDTIFLKTDHRMLRLSISSIRYVEGMSEYLKIHSDELPKPIIVLLSMKKMEDRLPKDRFMRIHRSYIVNLKKIREVNKNRVILDSDTFLPVGDLYRDAFLAYLESRYLGK